MRERLGRTGQLLLRLLLAPFRLLGRLLHKLWQGLGVIGLWLRRLLAAVLGPPWRFIGRMGLALRNLLTWTVWRPFLFFSAPWRLLYAKFVHRRLVRLLRWLSRAPFRLVQALARLIGRLVVQPARAFAAYIWRTAVDGWHRTRPGRQRLRRRWRSRWQVWRARWVVFTHRQHPPRKTITVPPAPRPDPPRRRLRRLATTVVTLGLVLVASLFTAQRVPQLRRAVARNDYQLSSSKFTTVTPTGAATTAPPTATPEPPTPTPWPTPDPLDGGGSVAFTLRQNGNSDIYALSIGQSQPVRLTSHPAGERDPAWSPNGRELAFASHRDGNWELYVLDLQSGDLRRLTDDLAFDAGPSWSPDGKWLVFESYRENNLDLFIVSADGRQGPIRLTEDPAPDFSPVWAPGGRHIAFTSWRSGNKDIFIMPLDAASDATALNVTGTPAGREDTPAFSPDGRFLSYDDDSTGMELVYTVALDNYAPSGTPVSRGQGRHPTWSPDGEALSYVFSRGGQSHLIAGSLDAWSVAPQAFTANGRLDDPAWTARTLPRELPPSLQATNQATDAPLFVETVAEPPDDGPPYLLSELSINAPSPYLSDRVDQSFLALRERVTAAAGWDFLGELDNMYEALDEQPLPGLAARSWNKAGRAFDIYWRHVLAFEPQIEVVRENAGSETYWRTYLQAQAQDGTQGEPLRDLPWDFRARFGEEPQYYDQGGKWKETIPAGYYVDFTTLAADYGWTRVPAADNWRTYFPGIRFWHYENRQGYTWMQAMLELYPAGEILDEFGGS